MKATLPLSATVNIAALSRLWDATTNSYKLVFFQALLNLIGQCGSTKAHMIFSLRELAIEMASVAWYPHTFFHLSFGIQDQLGKVLDALDFNVEERAIGRAHTQERLRHAIAFQSDDIGLQELLRFVPYRLLTPFFDTDLRGRKDHEKNALIRDLAQQTFNTADPALYRFVGTDDASIEMHPGWAQYLLKSMPIVQGWVHNHWITYLQSRNPNTPAIPRKIVPPLNRSALTQQTSYWRAIMATSSIRCLYSNATLEPECFALDHFVPWSFVCHDQIWNLIPVLPEANSAKGNRLPASRYLERFIDLQKSGLEIGRECLSNKSWNRATESFVSDLRISQAELLMPDRLRAAYLVTLPALISLAAQTGFGQDWVFDSRKEFGMGGS